MGVRESLPDDVVAELASASRKERIADLISLVRMIFCAWSWNLLHLERRIARFQARLDDALREPSPALTDMRLDELMAYYAQLEAKLLQRWDAPLINDFFAMIFHGALRKLTLQWLGDKTGALANDAIRGSGAMVSAEPAARVRELARWLLRRRGFCSLSVRGNGRRGVARGAQSSGVSRFLRCLSCEIRRPMYGRIEARERDPSRQSASSAAQRWRTGARVGISNGYRLRALQRSPADRRSKFEPRFGVLQSNACC